MCKRHGHAELLDVGSSGRSMKLRSEFLSGRVSLRIPSSPHKLPRRACVYTTFRKPLNRGKDCRQEGQLSSSGNYPVSDDKCLELQSDVCLGSRRDSYFERHFRGKSVSIRNWLIACEGGIENDVLFYRFDDGGQRRSVPLFKSGYLILPCIILP